MEAEAIERELKRFIIDNFMFGDASVELADDTSFLDTGKIDSTGVIELVSYVEDAFDCVVLPDEIVPHNFDSIAKIARFVRTKRAAQR